MDIKKLKERKSQIIEIASWCSKNKQMLIEKESRDRKGYGNFLRKQLRTLLDDILDKENGEEVIYEELLDTIPRILEEFGVAKGSVITKKICDIIINRAAVFANNKKQIER